MILLLATAGAVWVTWRGEGGLMGARFALPVLVVVVALTVAAMLGMAGVLPSAWFWAALGAYAVAWAEYLVTQTIGRSRASSAVR